MSDTLAIRIDDSPKAADHPSRQERAILRVSRDVLTLFIATGTGRFSVRELADNAGISERSFHRYFPCKEDSVRPALSAGVTFLAQALLARPQEETLPEALRAAFARSWWATNPIEAHVLRKVMHETDLYRAKWLQVIADAEAEMAVVIGQRLGIAPQSRQAVMAAACTFAAIRHSVEGFDPDEASVDHAAQFAANLSIIGGPLFSAPSETGDNHDQH